MSPVLNLRQFLKILRKEREIVDVFEEVDSHLEIAEIHRRVAAADGPALFFRHVKNSTFPVVTNLFGSKRRVSLAFQNRPEETIASLVHLITQEFPLKLSTLWNQRALLKKIFSLGTKKSLYAPVKEKSLDPPDLEKLPFLKTWPLDGGHFITLPLVYTEPPKGGPPNLGMYRIQRYDKQKAGLHFQIQKGGGFHYHQAEMENQPLPVAIFIGGAPALILSAIAPLPENVPELLMAGLLQSKKLSTSSCKESSYPLISECEFALLGKSLPHQRLPEGPFGDHYGYYSLTHDFPVFECEKIYHRKNAIYPATVVGKPKQEDFYIGNFLQSLLAPLFPLVMPSVKDFWSYGETGFHSLGAAIVKERFYRESMSSVFRILGEGQLSLTKFLFVTDCAIDLQNFKETLTTLLERFNPETDLFIFSHLSMDTLDYTGPALNKGSRGVMLGVGKKIRELPREFQGTLPSNIKYVAVFSPGCLVLECTEEQIDFSHLLSSPSFKEWPLLILVDHGKKTLASITSFLWTVFTRFEPAADIHAKSCRILHNHISFSGPLLIDARMKAHYPPEVQCDPHTADQVTLNWKNYFPAGKVEMGDSDAAHITTESSA